MTYPFGPQIAQVRRTGVALSRWVHRPGDLPGVVIIGAQKAGTTTLFHALRKHPSIQKGRAKELHFADRYWSFGEAWYRRCFAPGSGVGMEATPNYLFYPKAAERMAGILPDAKFIAILRDPVKRAVSHYNYLIKLGHSMPAFSEMPARERALDPAWEAAERTGHWSARLQRDSVLRRGLYGAHLSKWYDVVPKDRMLVVEDADLYNRPEKTLTSVQSFLGLDPIDLSVGHHNATGKSREIADNEELYDYFSEDSTLLRELTGHVFSWMR